MPDAKPYFAKYAFRKPLARPLLTPQAARRWQFLAVVSACFGASYLYWRLTASFNDSAPVFSLLVIGAEVLAFVGLILFYFDIWEEQDTPVPTQKKVKSMASVTVDVFITTFDEPIEVVEPSVADACALRDAPDLTYQVHLLDDGQREEMATLAQRYQISYLTRPGNRGFKAGNLREALLSTQGDFIVICDADTRLFPDFLRNTLPYFDDPKVSWVQTPHWFYDLPEGEDRNRFWLRRAPALARLTQRFRSLIGLTNRKSADPFMNDPDFFFDVIQRRRNRHRASFCCGAGSIHRREALMDVALQDVSTVMRKRFIRFPWARDPDHNTALLTHEARPFAYHVSEDILTSIAHHRRGWKSVYHPHVEARMLSPRTIEAWTLQRMKYAGGTFDIMCRFNPLLMKGVPTAIKLHYASTFWSYISILWLPILLFAPAISLITGWSPVRAYSLEFFQHLVPFLIAHEVAVLQTSKGYNVNLGRTMNIGLMPLHMKAAWNILRGRKPNFVPTPKIPIGRSGVHHLYPQFAILAVLAVAAIIGMHNLSTGAAGFTTAFVATNFLWLLWNFSIVWRTAKIAFWRDRSFHLTRRSKDVTPHVPDPKPQNA